MQTNLATLVFMSIVCGLAAAHAMEASSGREASESQPLYATVPNAGLVTSVSPPPSSHAGSLRRNPAPDCYGQRPQIADQACAYRAGGSATCDGALDIVVM